LSQKQMAELFDKNVRTVNEHIKNIFKEGELDESSVIRKSRITAADGTLYRDDGSKRLADNALVALTLLIAEIVAELEAVEAEGRETNE
jgi:hypothetical protein